MLFQDLGARKVVAAFSGRFLSNDGGALLLQQVDAGLGISRTLAACFNDERDPNRLEHSILSAAREQYDCIVVDSAPIQSVSDALLLAEKVDTVCLVVRYASTPRKAALRALHLFNDHGTPVEGIVFNYANPIAPYGYYSRSETSPLEATA